MQLNLGLYGRVDRSATPAVNGVGVSSFPEVEAAVVGAAALGAARAAVADAGAS